MSLEVSAGSTIGAHNHLRPRVYVTFADGVAADLGDLLGVLLMVLGAGPVYLYCANPRGMLDFESGE